MTYTPAQISASYGADVFYFDYAHADVAQTFTFGGGDWGLYQANNVAVSASVTPAYDNTGISIAGTILFSVTTQHLDTFACSHVEWDGSGVIVEYTLDGTTWHALAQDGVIPMNGDVDFDIRVSFAGGQASDPTILNSLTVYVLATGTTTSPCYRTLSFGSDSITDAGLLTVGGETISPTDVTSDLTTSAIEIYAAIGSLGAVLSGAAYSFSLNSSGVPVVTGCTVYVNGIESSQAPALVTGSIPYHFVIIPTTSVNEQLTLGAGLTMSNLALYAEALTSTDAYNLYSATRVGMPTITIDDTAVITVTESSPATDIYAYAWSVTSGGGQ